MKKRPMIKRWSVLGVIVLFAAAYAASGFGAAGFRGAADISGNQLVVSVGSGCLHVMNLKDPERVGEHGFYYSAFPSAGIRMLPRLTISEWYSLWLPLWLVALVPMILGFTCFGLLTYARLVVQGHGRLIASGRSPA